MRGSIVAIVIASFAACKSQDNPAPATAPSGAGDRPAAASSGAAVDICGFATKEQVETALGGTLEGEPERGSAKGLIQGECQWKTTAAHAMVSANPAKEYDGAVSMFEGKSVPGIGEKAALAQVGLLVKLAGKPYYLVVFVTPADKLELDATKATALATVLAAGAK